jgi:hypothetical protein
VRHRCGGLLAIAAAVALAGCGGTTVRVVTRTATVQTSRTITVVQGLQTFSSDPSPLPMSQGMSILVDPAGTTVVTYFGKLAGFGAAALQTNLAKQGAYWHYASFANAPFVTPVCEYRLLHSTLRVKIGVAEGTRTSPALANAVCAELLAVGWRPAGQSVSG